jgi:methionine synthase II (cobalamin-independent)
MTHGWCCRSDEACLYALADTLKHEFQAIANAGFVLQIDAPDAAMGGTSSSATSTWPANL